MTSPTQTQASRRNTQKHASADARQIRFGDWTASQQIAQGTLTELLVACPVDANSEGTSDYALKTIRRDLPADKAKVARQLIANEIDALTRISHPNVVPLLDGCVDAATENPHAFWVAPFLEGRTLENWLGSASPQPLPVYLWLVRQICQGLESIHAAGLVHGDIKPANAIVSSSGHVTLVDLGLSQEVSDEQVPFDLRGTLAYCAPERLRRETVISSAADMFSLGVVAYQLLTGSLPFGARSASDLKNQHATSDFKPLKSFLPQVPAGLNNVILRLLATDPLRRPTCRELVPVLLALEIETFGQHIQPPISDPRTSRAA